MGSGLAQVTSYVHGASELLGVQIDAAINAGITLAHLVQTSPSHHL